MKTIWPDGTVEEIPDEVPAYIKAYVDFLCWFESLTQKEQEKVIQQLNHNSCEITLCEKASLTHHQKN